ncbi:MAG TPA: condensation domain-containing protein [Pseudonocardiaceae bacterium]
MTNPGASPTAVRIAPLSFNQEFVCIFDQGDEQGPFGPRYHIVHGWRIGGRIDLADLQAALDAVVARHESLRTIVVRGEDKCQQVFSAQPVKLEVRELGALPADQRDAAAEQLLIDVEADTIPAGEVPLLRAIVGRFDDDDSVLVLMAHHTSTDGWSMRLIMRDLSTLYAVRRGHERPELPEAGQYGDYAELEKQTYATLDATKEWWRRQLDRGAIYTLKTDKPRSAGLEQTSAMHRFVIDGSVVNPALAMAKANRGSPFMALLAVYKIFVQRMSGGTTDVVVPTFSPGRGPQFENTVGSFFNFLPVRTDLSGCRTFRDVFTRVRRSCLESYAHDMPMILGEAPALMAPGMDDRHAPCVFQVFPYPHLLDRELIGDLEYTEIRYRTRAQELCSDIPDGGLWTLNLDHNGDVFGHVAFKNSLFDATTIRSLVADFTHVLTAVAADPDADLDTI